jgi:hypothetical protein
MQFPDASGVPVNMLPARDVSAFCSSRASRLNSQRGRHHREGLKVCGLSGGGNWIRTFGSARDRLKTALNICR